MPEILAIIPARGGSKGIPRKNIKRLCGKPLLSYTIEAAKNSDYISRIILSTEDDEIASIGKNLGIDVPFMRPHSLAQDDTPSLPVFQHVLELLLKKENYKPEIVIILQPTSPLRVSRHIDEALKKFLDSGADSLVSVMDVPHNMSPHSVMFFNEEGYLSNYIEQNELTNIRQLKPRFVARNGAAVYITTYSLLMERNKILGGKVIPYYMSKIESLDLDDLSDWIVAEAIIEWREKNEI